MTSITSIVSVCNLALGHLKVAPVSNVTTDPKTSEERICALYYDITRQAVLESVNWSFATKRAIVAASAAPPSFGFPYQSGPMPPDFLKLVGVYDPQGQIYINTNNQYYEFENNIIFIAQTAPYYIKYIADITDVSKFDRLFTMNLSYALAVSMSEALKISATLLQVLNEKWKEWQTKALVVNGQQGGVIRVNESNYIKGRRSPSLTGYSRRWT